MRSPDQLAKYLSYLLGRRPDELGLIPDSQGYVKIKDLLKALSEEQELKYVRQAHLNEIIVSVSHPPIEISENLIRAVSREHLKAIAPADDLPKLLYSCVRQRAHPVVLEKGLIPGAYPHVILSENPEMAKRIGRRSDPEPLLISVYVQKAKERGIIFYQAGEELYLADSIPPDCLSVPPLPKQKEEAKKKSLPEERKMPLSAGSFLLSFEDEEKKKEFLRKKRKREMDHDKAKRKIRKQKQTEW